MKLIFLHGLGQDASSWRAIQEELSNWESEAVELFPNKTNTYQDCKEDLLNHLRSQQGDFVLIGLSLGAILALELSDQDLPHLRGLVLSGAQYKLGNNLIYKLQNWIFKFLPKKVFEKQGADKVQMLGVLKDLSQLDLTQQAKSCQLPTLILCGNQDKANLTASQELHALIQQSEFTVIPDGGHTLNTGKAQEFAQALVTFLTKY